MELRFVAAEAAFAAVLQSLWELSHVFWFWYQAPKMLPSCDHPSAHSELNEPPLWLTPNHISLSDMGTAGQTHTPPPSPASFQLTEEAAPPEL